MAVAGIPALIVCLLTALFAVLVYRQLLTKRRLNLGFWMLSLTLSALGSLGYCLALWTTSPRVWFEIYYLCGAMWMPCLMGLGSLALIFGRRTVWIAFAGVCILGIFGSIELVRAPVDLTLLNQLNGGAGTAVIVERLGWLVALIVLNTFGALAVILVAILSALRTIRRKSSTRFLYGNIWLAAGVLVISLAGSAARMGWPSLFWVVMLLGWVAVFVGYCLLTPATASQQPVILAGKHEAS